MALVTHWNVVQLLLLLGVCMIRDLDGRNVMPKLRLLILSLFYCFTHVHLMQCSDSHAEVIQKIQESLCIQWIMIPTAFMEICGTFWIYLSFDGCQL